LQSLIFEVRPGWGPVCCLTSLVGYPKCASKRLQCSRHTAKQQPGAGGAEGVPDQVLGAEALANRLMRHQHGQRHMVQQVSGNAAEHELPQAGMTVAADHEQVGADIGSIAEQDIGR